MNTKKHFTYLIFVFALYFFTSAKKPVQQITVYPNQVICDNLIGVGVQWSAYPHADSRRSEWGALMTDSKWNTLYERLDYMQPRVMRVIDQANWRYFQGLDGRGKPIINYDNEEVRSLMRILDYCQKNNITVMIGEWGIPGHCHDKENTAIRLRSISDTRWQEMIADWIDFLINKKGYSCIKYYDFVNEPNGSWSCTDGNFAEWALGVNILYDSFKKRGLDKKIQIAGPGSVPNAQKAIYKDKYDATQWVKYTSEVLGQKVGMYNTHAYYPHMSVRAGKAAEYMHFKQDVAIADRDKKPFILGEIGLKATKDKGEFAEEHERRRIADGFTAKDCNMYVYEYFFGIDIASAAIQSLLAGVDGMTVWNVDDAMHTESDLADITKMKRYGFWNILGTELHNRPQDENIRPWYYAWSWLSRYMPQGSTILKSDQPKNAGSQLLVSVYENHYTYYMVNTSEESVSFNLVQSGAAKRSYKQLTYHEQFSNQTAPFGEKSIITDLNKGHLVTLPPKAFVVLTSQINK